MRLKSEIFLKQTKNIHDNIDVFYGLREPYIHESMSVDYYDEILNYMASPHMRKSSIINKVQGVTYYLASKHNIHDKLSEKIGDDIYNFHPLTTTIVYNSDTSKMTNFICEFLYKHCDIKKWIIKPAHGSRGACIEIFDVKSSIFFTYKQVTKTSKKISEFIENNHIYKNKDDSINNYKFWILSQYIDNPHLLKLDNDTFGRKYNIRFYVLLVVKDLPVYKNFNNDDVNRDPLEIYVFNNYMIYTSMLEYNSTSLPKKYQKLDKDKYLSKMINTTNLEIIEESCNELLNSHNIYVDKLSEKSKFTNLLSKLYHRDSTTYKNIERQSYKIITSTINSVRSDLRPLNRFSDGFKNSFNLLAYDTLLDSDKNLWFIEVNRGPDLNALRIQIGDLKCEKMFDELFKITIDKYYNDSNLDMNDIEMWKKITKN